jgi:Na+-transporting NADH:ubiquinone oxidoreductase subunit NqrB
MRAVGALLRFAHCRNCLAPAVSGRAFDFARFVATLHPPRCRVANAQSRASYNIARDPGIEYEPPSNASRADGVTLIVALLNP